MLQRELFCLWIENSDILLYKRDVEIYIERNYTYEKHIYLKDMDICVYMKYTHTYMYMEYTYNTHIYMCICTYMCVYTHEKQQLPSGQIMKIHMFFYLSIFSFKNNVLSLYLKSYYSCSN